MIKYKRQIILMMIMALVLSLTGCLSDREKDNIISTLEKENIINSNDKLVYSWVDDASPIPAIDNYNYYYLGDNGYYLISVDASGSKDNGYLVTKTLDVIVEQDTLIETEEDIETGELTETIHYEYNITDWGTDEYTIELKVVEFKFFWVKLGERMVVTNYELN